MNKILIVLLLCLCFNLQAQTYKDTVIYNYIYRDTVIYNVVEPEDEGGIDLSNWGIGPYVGIDYSYYKQWGGGFGYSIGFGVSYYIYRIPSLRKKKKK